MSSIFFSPTFLSPVHLLANSTLLGMQLWQSFVMVKVAYIALSPEPFTLLQKRVFPVYFRSQCALIVLSAITFPINGPAGLLKDYGHWIPHLVGVITATLNLTIFGPKTSRLMMIKRSQEKARQDEKTNDQSKDKRDGVARGFSRNHAMSIHLNLITIGSTLWYGWKLASQFSFHPQ